MTDLNAPAPQDSPREAHRTTARSGRARFSLARWMLAPRTTWQARGLAGSSGMDAESAWVTARLARHPEERGFLMRSPDSDHQVPD